MALPVSTSGPLLVGSDKTQDATFVLAPVIKAVSVLYLFHHLWDRTTSVNLE